MLIALSHVRHMSSPAVRGVDLARPLGDEDFAAIVKALGRHGVLRFPDQQDFQMARRHVAL